MDEDARREEKLRIELELLANPITYFSTNREIPLPIEANEVNWRGTDFSFLRWKGAYLIPQLRPKGEYRAGDGRWMRDNYDVYLVGLDGESQVVSTPWRALFYARPALVTLSRAGLIFAPSGYDSSGREPVLGPVLWSNSRPELLDFDETQLMRLSPNGCRVVYDARDIRAMKEGRVVVRLRAVDVCKGER
jgi:hypothetical protein